MINIWNIASESADIAKEIELVMYAKIGNIDGLQQAVEKIHQREIIGNMIVPGLDKPQRWRIRETNDHSYEFTIKKRVENDQGLNEFIEDNVIVTKDLWNTLRSCANKGHDKYRYVFNAENVVLKYYHKDFEDKRQAIIPKLKYEVDVYLPPSHSEPIWCKIDIELQDALQHLKENYPEIDKARVNISVSHLPFKPVNVIMSNDPDPQKQQILGQIWETQFNLNPKDLK